MKRRALVKGGTLVLLLGAQQIARGATILAVRVWPAPDYTRVTIESDGLLVSRPVVVPDPPRLAVDIEGIELNPALRELVAKVKADDPFIAGIRIGQGSPAGVRLVIDLKQAALPQVFNLPPVAAYQHRLVMDLYPRKAADPLEELIAQRMKDSAARPAPLPAPAPAGDPLGELIAKVKTDDPFIAGIRVQRLALRRAAGDRPEAGRAAPGVQPAARGRLPAPAGAGLLSAQSPGPT